MLVVLLLCAACGNSPSAPAKKTVTVTLHAGEQLELGGYAVAVQRITGQEMEFTINGKTYRMESGERTGEISAIVSADATGPVAQIQITER